MDRETAITHLMIIHTWASFARERDLQFFTPKHLEDIAQWSDDAIAMLKEQEELLRKLQNNKNKLCLEVSEWKHKFHDAPPKFVSQGVVDQIRWERDVALSQLEQIGKGLGSKMDDIVALLKEQDTKKNRIPYSPDSNVQWT